MVPGRRKRSRTTMPNRSAGLVSQIVLSLCFIALFLCQLSATSSIDQDDATNAESSPFNYDVRTTPALQSNSLSLLAISTGAGLMTTVHESDEQQTTHPRLPQPEPLKQCAMSELTCDNGKCIPLIKFCDNTDDCGDGSDEPRYCTRCNRTYYGNIGLTYDLELHRPKEDKIPYVCILTISAAGGRHGDIVQIMLDSFTIGKFVSYTQDGCPDGYLQIAETYRQPIGGMWCGSSWGPVMFYSETRSLVLTVKLFRLARDQAGYNFDFRIKYKVLSRDSAVVRYGGIKYKEIKPWHMDATNVSSSPRGDLVMNTSTSYVFNRTDGDNNNNNWWSSTTAASPSLLSKIISYDSTMISNSQREVNSVRNSSVPVDQFSVRNNSIVSGAGSRRSNLAREEKRQMKINNRIKQSYFSNINNNTNEYIEANDPESLAGMEFERSHTTNYSEPKYYLGKLIQGTYCSRVFNDCDKRACRIQSPNFPGIYPRNLTCFYAIRQYDVPPGKHALISVRQPKGNLIWIASQSLTATKVDKNEKFVPRINTWDDCDQVQDYITVYDGYTTRDPIMLKFCGGGQQLPAAIASGAELLVEFTTSPYGTFVTPLSNMNGFQLEVEVKFVNANTPSYIENKKLCEFWLRGTGRGELENPQHSIPPNTTCLYHFQGTDVAQSQFPSEQVQMIPRRGTANITPPPPRFKVWIQPLKFDLPPPFGASGNPATMHQPTIEDCSGLMRIWDGPLRESPQCRDLKCERDPAARVLGGSKHSQQNYTNILTRYCRGNVPRSCEYKLMNGSVNRPCPISESFISSSEFLTIEVRNTESTALRPLTFKLKYEFVDLHQDGVPANAPAAAASTQDVLDCDRKFVSSLLERKELHTFKSIRNVFFFGRGGNTNLTCTLKFEAQRGERVRVVIRKVRTGFNRTCGSKIDEDTDRSYCFGDSRIKVQIFEKPWHDSIPFFRGCICNASVLQPQYAKGNSTTAPGNNNNNITNNINNKGGNSVSVPVIYTSTSRELEIHFSAINMTDEDDPEHIFFEGTFEFIKAPVHCKDIRRKFGASGTIDLSAGELECRSRPWMVEPTSGVTANEKFLYIHMYGLELYRYDPDEPKSVYSSHLPFNSMQKNFNRNSVHCLSKTRVIITTGNGLSVTICPIEEGDADSDQTVQVFSSGWNKQFAYLMKESPKQISVELLEPDSRQRFTFSWLEMSRSPIQGLYVGESCRYQCPELDACVNSSVWCNGKSDCPSGYDESFTHCSSLLQLPAEVLAALCAFIVALCCGFSAILFKKICRYFRSSSVLQTRLKSLSSMDTAVFDEKEVIS